jgi:phosphohistidine phosphatase
MHLYLVRHAHAVDAADDAARELSKKGREQVKTLGKFLLEREIFTPAAIWHSPLVRARETAELLAKHVRLAARPSETAGLLPEDDPAVIVARVAHARLSSLALVGHEPFMSALASLLVTGDPLPPRFTFRKCAALALQGEGTHWSVLWFLSPEVVGEIGA